MTKIKLKWEKQYGNDRNKIETRKIISNRYERNRNRKTMSKRREGNHNDWNNTQMTKTKSKSEEQCPNENKITTTQTISKWRPKFELEKQYRGDNKKIYMTKIKWK